MADNSLESSTATPAATQIAKVPIWFRALSGIALLWNLMGILAFVVQVTMTDDMLVDLPADQQALYKTMPSWVNIAFGIAVIGGALGCLLLLLRSRFATPVLVLSLLGVLAQNVYMFFLSDTFKVMGNGAMAMPIMIISIAVLLVLFSLKANKRGWLR
jgi:hypothetical protein